MAQEQGKTATQAPPSKYILNLAACARHPGAQTGHLETDLPFDPQEVRMELRNQRGGVQCGDKDNGLGLACHLLRTDQSRDQFNQSDESQTTP